MPPFRLAQIIKFVTTKKYKRREETMPYWERVVYAGKTKEIKKYYSRRHHPKERRVAKAKETEPAQEKVNIRNQTEKLRWLLNCNFEGGDMHVVFKFAKEERPDSYEELVKIKNKLLRSLRRQYEKQGKVMKYVYVLETGSRGAMHIHMVLNSMEPKILSRCWKRGHIHIETLDDTGQYGKLAAYLVKEKGIKKQQKYGGKAYSPIKEPKETRNHKKSGMGTGFLPGRRKKAERILHR